MEEIQNLLQALQEKKILPNQNDLMLMREAKDGCFSVKLFYKVLFGSNSIVFPHQLIWSNWVPTKMSFFAWEASWGKVLTLDQIKKRGRALANRCFLCGKDEETIDHLLLHCPVARLLWDLLLAIFGCIGCSLSRFQKPSSRGVAPVWVREGKRLGWLRPKHCFGLFGVKEITLLLKIWSSRLKG